MRVTRRAVLLGAAVAGLTACAGSTPTPVRIAAGEAGGFYLEFGDLLAAALRADGTPATTVSTGGSVDNLAWVTSGRAALGLTLADVAVTSREAASGVEAIGRVYENYMQFVVRASSPLRSVSDLAGRVVSLGAAGSGAATFGDRLLATVGISASVIRRPLAEAIHALEAGAIDALLWSGGVPTPALAELAQRMPIRVLPLDGPIPSLQSRYGAVYSLVSVPAGIYGASEAVPVVGVANLLVCLPAQPDNLVAAVARTLVTAAPRLVPDSALGTQFLDQRALIDTGAVPMHPGATRAYRDLHG